MSRWRTSVGLFAFAIGVSVAVGGPRIFEAAAAALWTHADVAVVALVVFLILRRVAPKGSLKLPGAVGALGLVLLGFRHDFWTVSRAFAISGTVLAVIGAHAVLSTVTARRDPADPVQRLTAVLRNSEVQIQRDDPMPGYLAVTGIGADARVDLSDAVWPGGLDYLEIASSCWAGRVDIVLPDSWRVVAGRVHRTWRTRFDGRLDLPQPYPYPFDSLAKVEKALSRKPSEGLVFVHAVGAWGWVKVTRPAPEVSPGQSSRS